MGSRWEQLGREGSARPERRAGSGSAGAGALAMREDQARAGESFLNCPRCGLTIKPRAPWLAVRFCPRCLARSQSVVELFSSALPAEALYAEGSAPRADRRGDERRPGLR
jgi:hypothetical protein